LGTSPTGMFATTFLALVSIADTDLMPELETYINLLSGVNVTQFGNAPIGC
jgi:hypothetical protein